MRTTGSKNDPRISVIRRIFQGGDTWERVEDKVCARELLGRLRLAHQVMQDLGMNDDEEFAHELFNVVVDYVLQIKKDIDRHHRRQTPDRPLTNKEAKVTIEQCIAGLRKVLKAMDRW